MVVQLIIVGSEARSIHAATKKGINIPINDNYCWFPDDRADVEIVIKSISRHGGARAEGRDVVQCSLVSYRSHLTRCGCVIRSFISEVQCVNDFIIEVGQFASRCEIIAE